MQHEQHLKLSEMIKNTNPTNRTAKPKERKTPKIMFKNNIILNSECLDAFLVILSSVKFTLSEMNFREEGSLFLVNVPRLPINNNLRIIVLSFYEGRNILQ